MYKRAVKHGKHMAPRQKSCDVRNISCRQFKPSHSTIRRMRLPLTTAIGALSGYAYYSGNPVPTSTVAPFLGVATGINFLHILSTQNPVKPHIAAMSAPVIVLTYYGVGWLAGHVIADATKNVKGSNDT